MKDKRKEVLLKMVETNPLLLLSLKDKESIEFVNGLLPFSIGIEIECDQLKFFNREAFKSIPNIMEVNVDSSEQRFRIPEGIKGLIVLWHLSETLKINSVENEEAGIHYHVDLTGNYHLLEEGFNKIIGDIILNELDLWEYKGTFNSRGFSGLANKSCRSYGSYPWCRFQSYYKTIEYRIGEMTFDYNLLITRIFDLVRLTSLLIIHIEGTLPSPNTKIANNIKEMLNFEPFSGSIEDKTNQRVSQLRNKLSKLEEPEEKEEEIDMESIIRNRTINGR